MSTARRPLTRAEADALVARMPRAKRLTPTRLAALNANLLTLAEQYHDDLSPSERDDLSRVRAAIHRILGE